MTTVTVSRLGERLVAAKRADGDSAAKLRAEARLLEALDHPGLVQFIDVNETGDSVVMRTVFAGTDTWASHPVLDPIARAAGVAAIAATLCDLHARGVTHGSLRPEHVIWGDDGRPVLCGLSRSRAHDDKARDADLVALAALLEDPPLDEGPRAGALRSLASRLRSGSLEAADVVEMANRIAADSGRRPTPARVRPRRASIAGAVMVLVAVGTIAVAAAGPRSRTEPLADGSNPGPTAPTATGSRQGGAAPVADSVPMPPDQSSVPQPEVPDRSGPVIHHEGRRYFLGQDGDVVVLGDWDCDGSATAAVLRPDTGEIAVFDEWPAAGRSISAVASWTIEGAILLDAHEGSACDQLRVSTPDGSRLLDQDPAR